MRILFFSSMYPSPWNPGRGVFNRQLIASLAASHAVTVVAPVSWTDKLRKGRAEPADDTVAYPTFFHVPLGMRETYTALMAASAGRGLRKAIGAFQPDVVLAYWAHPDGEVAARCAGSLGIPTAIMVGGSDVLVFSKTRRGRLVTRALHAADLVVAVSQHLADRIVELGLPPERVKVAYRGVERALFCRGDRDASRKVLGLPDRPLAVCVSRLVPVKKLDRLLEVWRILKDCREAPHLYVLGDGPQHSELQRLSGQLDLLDCVTFVGPVKHSQLPHWYRAANLTVLSSESEGIPNVLLESVSCGTPFVSTNVGGVAEIADAELDRLVPYGNNEAFASGIRELFARTASEERRRFVPLDAQSAAANLAQILGSVSIRQGGVALAHAFR